MKWQEVRAGGELETKKSPVPSPTPVKTPTQQFQHRPPNPFVNPSPTRWQQIPEPQQEFSFFTQLLLPLLLGMIVTPWLVLMQRYARAPPLITFTWKML